MVIAVDLDGVLTVETAGYDYATRTPRQENIDKINQLKGRGHKIVIYTARWSLDKDVTEKWLHRYGVNYDRLVLGKLSYDVFFDDKSLPQVESELEYDFHRSCWRYLHGKVLETEAHPCFFCGEDIPLTTTECGKCGIMICPGCGKCLCNISVLARITMFKVHQTYCCHLPDFKGKIELSGPVDADVVRHCEKSLMVCAQKEHLL